MTLKKIILSFALILLPGMPLPADTGGRWLIPDPLLAKIGDGNLVRMMRDKMEKASEESNRGILSSDSMWVFVYFDFQPTARELSILRSLHIDFKQESWTKPSGKHPLGYMLVHLPVNSVVSTLALQFIKRMESAERRLAPQNNNAYKAVEADDVWTRGYTGAGIKMAILDSGLDTDPANPDLPGSIQKKDYSNYPALDDNVENTVTGHGTHVAATALGRGLLSAANTGNGGGAYKGMAPAADLAFLKIGNDADGSASYAAIDAALTAAVGTYGADIISMSYGGWDTYHDGSEPMDQKIDWCYAQGVPVFISAGNDGGAGRHCSGTVGASGESGYIRVNVSGAGTDNTKLKFNLVWYDGPDSDHSELSLKYYNSSLDELTDATWGMTTESLRGTESNISYYNPFLPSGSGIYYLKVFNSSSAGKTYHLYEDYGNGTVIAFASPDPAYTISSPATADHAFAVGAWTSRQTWINFLGSSYTYGLSPDDICAFSSRGPRVDGAQKPDIAAPGSAVISLRDRDVIKNTNSPLSRWIDDDDVDGGDTTYYVMQGTSMACPVVAGAAALLLQKYPALTPQEVYDTLGEFANADGYTGSCPNSTWGRGKLYIDSAFESTILAEVKIIIEGPYSSVDDTMSTQLDRGEQIPLTSPYVQNGRTVASIPNDIVDWILVELRSTADGDEVASKSAFLRKDGRIVADDGSTEQIILNCESGDYFILVKHRNHCAAMGAVSTELSNSGSILYDFTAGASKFYGANGYASFASGKTGLWAGDINSDGGVYSEDYTQYRTAQGQEGYRPADLNLDGGVYAEDYTLYRNNQGRESSVP